MSRREKLPFPTVKLAPLAGLGKIEGEHTEYKVSVGTWKALNGSRKNTPFGMCVQDGEYLRRYLSIGRNLNGKHVKNRKALTEMSGLAALMLKEIKALRKKGVKGAIPVCLQPDGHPHPDKRVAFVPASTEMHERFHAQNSRRRVRLGVKEAHQQINCEGDQAVTVAAKLTRVPEKKIRASMPDYWVGGILGAGLKPEELFARAEPLRVICHVKKNKKDCAVLTERFRDEMKHIKAPKTNLIRDLADAMQRRRVTGEKLFDGFAKSCKVKARAGARRYRRR
jgi:hypothetical protein